MVSVRFRLRDIPYEMQFYWKGDRYKQLLRAKNPRRGATVICYMTKNGGQNPSVSMPLGRVIKPVIRSDANV